uniref:UBX domain-containing protein 4 n=1 Tax=Timema douglasi TaxID=61478 RepID=A0A7R8VNL3_TIMDO|nr:unnamed protein product [Timema douglasi]
MNVREQRCFHLGLHMAIPELKDSSSPNQWSNFNLEAVGGGRSGVYPICGPGSFFTHITADDEKIEVRISVGCTEGDKPLNQSLHCLYRTRTGENPFASRSDEASKDTATAINNLEVSSKLESDDFIAIKLDSGSEAYRQFAQIYQIVPVPSLFFIGSAGAPLEVVAGKVSVSDLVLRVDGVLQKHRSSTPSLPKPLESPAQSISALESKPSTSGLPHPSETESSIISEANISLSTTSPPETTPDVSVGSTLSAPNTSAFKSEEPPTSIAEEVETAASKEERIKRAQELLELKRLQKLKEEKEEPRCKFRRIALSVDEFFSLFLVESFYQVDFIFLSLKERIKELERRQVGQEVQNMRRLQQDQEIKLLKEERQREKAEDAAARGRILKQIEQDRAERAARFNSEKAAQQEELSKRQQEQLAEQARQLAEKQASSSSVAHIQFRIPNDSPHTHKFAATDTLGDVYTYLNSQLNLPFREFSLFTNFPRRELSQSSNSQTLRDLELVPSAVILILPLANALVVLSSTAEDGEIETSSGSVVTSSGDVSVVTRFIRTLITPIFAIYNYVWSLVFGRGEGSPAEGQTERRNTRKEPGHASGSQPNIPSQGVKRRNNLGETKVARREGNIHRLTNRDSSDDENNTWNGNSTQQM